MDDMPNAGVEAPATLTIAPRRAVTTVIDGDQVTVLEDEAAKAAPVSTGAAAPYDQSPTHSPSAEQE